MSGVGNRYCEPSCDESQRTNFCGVCGRALPGRLEKVRLAGFVGVMHSTSPKIEQFWETGDPSVFERK